MTKEAKYYDLRDEVKRLLRYLYRIGSEIGLSDKEIDDDVRTEVLYNKLEEQKDD